MYYKKNKKGYIKFIGTSDEEFSPMNEYEKRWERYKGKNPLNETPLEDMKLSVAKFILILLLIFPFGTIIILFIIHLINICIK